MRLADWQSAFIHALEPQGNANKLTQLVNERELNRVDIYRNNAFQALNSALQLVFPVCKLVVGEACFTQLVKGYCQQYPLADCNLNRYGQHFSYWLAIETCQHAAFKDLEYLPELAQLEWLLNQSYYSMDLHEFMQSTNCRLEALAELSESAQQQVTLLLRPDVALLTCQYQVQLVWARHNTQQGIQEYTGSGPHYLVIYRDRFKVQLSVVSKAEMFLLQAIASGQTLAQITNSELDLSLLSGLIERQWVCGFSLPVTDLLAIGLATKHLPTKQ
ncbi:HvfC/BufC family peptide modification chaperone [Shewanella sp. 0m-4]